MTMANDHRQIRKLFQPGIYSFVLACGWTCAVSLSLGLTTLEHKQGIQNIAVTVARAHIDKDILFRDWNEAHGGIYVPVTPDALPNVYLPSSVQERDIKTPSGQVLTFVNPSNMTRQIYEFARKEKQFSGRLTSLKPLRIENEPDAWETLALTSFLDGKQEVSEVIDEGKARYLRLMRPLNTEIRCLKCHAEQGYREGDILGGVSIKLPMTQFDSAMQQEIRLLWAGHVSIGLLGLYGLYAGYRGLKRRTWQRDQAELELKRLNIILEGQATTDFLTGISNRLKFDALLRAEISEARRYNLPLTLIFFDIDHFKEINDTFGHDVGDGVLREIAHHVSNFIREVDIFARFGGEEFVILTHNDQNTAHIFAEKIRSMIAKHDFRSLKNVTCSFGVTQFRLEDTAESFLIRADKAMYKAKETGRNRVEVKSEELN